MTVDIGKAWFLILVLLGGIGCDRVFPMVTIKLPVGYVGWVRVDLESDGCASGSVVEVDSTGVGCLGRPIHGWTVTTYKRIGDDVELSDRGSEESRRIWAQSTIEWKDKLGVHRALGFFVGTHQQLRSMPPPRLPRVD